MALSRKHFKAIAKIIKLNTIQDGQANDFGPDMGEMIFSGDLVDSFCDYFKEENPNFNEAKFKEACGL